MAPMTSAEISEIIKNVAFEEFLYDLPKCYFSLFSSLIMAILHTQIPAKVNVHHLVMSDKAAYEKNFTEAAQVMLAPFYWHEK